MQDSLDHLLREPEVPSDEVLAAMASALRIEEDIIAASGWRFFEPEVFNASKPPPMVHVKALSAALENLRRSLRPELLESSKLSPSLFQTVPHICVTAHLTQTTQESSASTSSSSKPLSTSYPCSGVPATRQAQAGSTSAGPSASSPASQPSRNSSRKPCPSRRARSTACTSAR